MNQLVVANGSTDCLHCRQNRIALSPQKSMKKQFLNSVESKLPFNIFYIYTYIMYVLVVNYFYYYY